MGKSQRDSNEKAPSLRLLRVSENVRHAIATIIARGDVHDLAHVSITVSEVRVSPDLRNAVVYIMPLGGVDKEIVIKALNKAGPYIRSQLGKRVRMKYLPRLAFRLDESYDEASHINALLSNPKVQQDVTSSDIDDE